MLEQILSQAVPIQPLSSFSQADVLRLDQLHPLISGNKAFKLFGHLQQAHAAGAETLLSFGGPYSNHLHALAAAGKYLALKTVGIIRGYQHLPLTPTLLDCQNMGMTLIFADKKNYGRRYDKDYCSELAECYQAYVIEEGGSGDEGEIGCRFLTQYCREYDQVWLAVGSGTTGLGLAKALTEEAEATPLIVGVNMVADHGERLSDWRQKMPNSNWQLLDNYHCGGFAKFPDSLRGLIQRYDSQDLPLDPIYTAKLVNAFEQECELRPELRQQRVLLIHSGGLQGRRGLGM